MKLTKLEQEISEVLCGVYDGSIYLIDGVDKIKSLFHQRISKEKIKGIILMNAFYWNKTWTTQPEKLAEEIAKELKGE